MSGRQFFSDVEKICLQELIIKYKLNTNTTMVAGNPAAKRLAWQNLVAEFNSISSNSKRTEAQLKKCWDNLKTRKKKALSQDKRERMKTGGGTFNPQPGTSEDILMEDALLEQTDIELQFVVDSDYCAETSCQQVSPPAPAVVAVETTIDYDETNYGPFRPQQDTNENQEENQQQIFNDSSTKSGAKNIRTRVISEEFKLRTEVYSKRLIQEQELHHLKIKEQLIRIEREETLLKKAKLELEMTEELKKKCIKSIL